MRAEFNDPENVTFCTLGRGWPIDIWPFQNGMAYLGKDGGGGLGSGPGLSVGAALALHGQGRHAVSMLGDGDFCMGVTAIWTAVRHRIPLLVLINNNRSYFNDELHQDTVARTRGREVKNRWIGLRMEDPVPDIAKLAEAQGAVGIGPVTSAADVSAAISKGVVGAQIGRRLRDRLPHRPGRGARRRRRARPSPDRELTMSTLVLSATPSCRRPRASDLGFIGLPRSNSLSARMSAVADMRRGRGAKKGRGYRSWRQNYCTMLLCSQ